MFALDPFHANPSVPALVTGDPLAVMSAGALRPTLVTVPMTVGLPVMSAHAGVIVTELAPVRMPFELTTPTMDVVAPP
jgi:hypothetical protein